MRLKRQKLKGRIVEKYGTVTAFAEKFGTTPQTVGNVLRGDTTPKGLALSGWLAALDIPENEAYIFFTESLENKTAEEG